MSQNNTFDPERTSTVTNLNGPVKESCKLETTPQRRTYNNMAKTKKDNLKTIDHQTF